MELAFVWNNFWTQLFLFLLTDCAPLMLKQISFCSVNTFSLLKQCKKTLAKVFFVFILCFVKHKSVKIVDIHIMWLVFISYKQEVYRVFKFLIWNVNWKSQLVFITKHVSANVVLRFNFIKIIFSQRKPNPIIIKTISKPSIFSCILSGSIFTGLICLTWHHKKHFWSLFLMLISPFFELLNSAGNFT